LEGAPHEVRVLGELNTREAAKVNTIQVGVKGSTMKVFRRTIQVVISKRLIQKGLNPLEGPLTYS